jgi:hypothetical protein
MGTVYDGVPANVAFPAAVAISSSTNTNPITITTTAPHGLLTGDLAHVYGHTLNTPANGIWAITRTGASTYTIPVAGIAAGSTTGSSQALTYGAALTLPSDGDADAAAVFNAALTPLTDRSAVTVSALGQYKIAQKSIAYYSNPLAGVGTPWSHISAGPVTAATAAQMTSDGVAWAQVVGSNFVTMPTSAGVAPVFQLAGVVPGDVCAIRLSTTLNLLAAGAGRIALYGSVGPPTIVPTWPGSYSAIAGASAYGGIICAAVTVDGVVTVAGTGVTTLWIQPAYVPVASSGSTSPIFGGDTVLTVDVLRPTLVPQ